MPDMKSAISGCTARLEMLHRDVVVGVGTGFFYSYNGRTFLVTNRHNLTGRDQNSRQPLDPEGRTPTGLRFRAPQVTLLENGAQAQLGPNIENFRINWTPDNVPWIEHPVQGPLFDVVAIDFARVFPEAPARVFCANSLPNERRILLQPSLQVSVVGHPFGRTVGDCQPIWVTGSLASEPEFDVDELPAIHIDCRTNKGSSGSPVFCVLVSGVAQVENPDALAGAIMQFFGGEDGELPAGIFPFTIHRFIGIYSGRINANADIGLVWRQSVIEEICSAAPV